MIALNKSFFLPSIFAFCLIAPNAFARTQDSEFVTKLKAMPRVKEVKTGGTAARPQYEIMFEQPVDHQNPSGDKFQQRIFLVNAGADKPVILGAEGYSAGRASGSELTAMLGGPNLLTVEHRYFGRSMPSPVEWKYLTIRNAADDMHDIVTTFKELYKGKWVATGASKGGQTSLFFKSYYPDDVDVTVAYVAPINLGQEDPRIYRWLDTVGDAPTRQKIKDLQIAFLKKEDEILELMKPDEKQFSMGVKKAFEYGVLEFPFAMWQYGTKPEGLPSADASAKDLMLAYVKVNPMFYYSDNGIKTFQAFYYQAFTEIGYYNYDITDFKPYLKANPNPTNLDLCPPGTKETIVYNPATLAFVYNFLQYKANNVIYIYGETDTWSATQMELLGRNNSLKFVIKDAYHNAQMRLASPEQKKVFYDTMDQWLGMKLIRN